MPTPSSTGLSLALTAKFFRGFAEPARLALLETLLDGEKSVTQLVEATGLSQPNASNHLACLRECGLVASRQEGRYAYYSLADPRTKHLLHDASAILEEIGDRIYECTRHRAPDGQ